MKTLKINLNNLILNGKTANWFWYNFFGPNVLFSLSIKFILCALRIKKNLFFFSKIQKCLIESKISSNQFFISSEHDDCLIFNFILCFAIFFFLVKKTLCYTKIRNERKKIKWNALETFFLRRINFDAELAPFK